MNKHKKARLVLITVLVFSFIVTGCKQSSEKDTAPTIEWDGSKAVALFIPRTLIGDLESVPIAEQLHVYLAKDSGQQAILGNYKINSGFIVFRPLIPFTKGLKYEVRWKNKWIAEVAIPAASAADRPEIVSVYPHVNVVPSNLLKIHIQFSKPMQEGQITDYSGHVTMRKRTSDTSPSIFADLGLELWNSDRTLLTLWLDPGRIKRDLQPNKKLGPPLEEGMTYHLIIRGMRDTDGNTFEFDYIKDFTIGPRDSISPGIERWSFHVPKAGAMDSLKIDFHETLDYVLLKNCIRITDANGNAVTGNIEVINMETGVCFIPAAAWKPGEYILECEARLEDLAGNNLNRLFDRDITKNEIAGPKEIYSRRFTIQ